MDLLLLQINFTTVLKVLQTGTPIAVLVTIVGLVWHFAYTYSRDKSRDEQARQQRELEREKFDHQKKLEREKFDHQAQLEKQRFDYEKQRWREELGRDIMVKLLAERVEAYEQLWKHIEVASISRNEDPTSQEAKETARKTATEIRKWRYGKGGLLAEDITRDAIYRFQQALWAYDGSEKSYRAMRQARKLVVRSLRSDLGLGEDASGRTIFEISAARQAQKEALEKTPPTSSEKVS
jgi:hypothetical protein